MKGKRWTGSVWFVVERFQRWVGILCFHPDVESWVRKEKSAPLDVLIVWYAYTVNPMCVYFLSVHYTF